MVMLSEAMSALFSRRSLMALPAALALVIAFLALAPASWFLKVHSIQIVQSDDGRIALIQARTIWPREALPVIWTAQIDRLTRAEDGRTVGATVCSGQGRATIRDDDFEIIKMPLHDWVGDPSCALESGIPHVAHASWSFVVLGFTKTATHRSSAFVQRAREVALNG